MIFGKSFKRRTAIAVVVLFLTLAALGVWLLVPLNEIDAQQDGLPADSCITIIQQKALIDVGIWLDQCQSAQNAAGVNIRAARGVFYQITVEERLRFEMTLEAGTAGEIVVYDSGWMIIDDRKDGFWEHSSQLVETLEPGTYYIELTGCADCVNSFVSWDYIFSLSYRSPNRQCRDELSFGDLQVGGWDSSCIVDKPLFLSGERLFRSYEVDITDPFGSLLDIAVSSGGDVDVEDDSGNVMEWSAFTGNGYLYDLPEGSYRVDILSDGVGDFNLFSKLYSASLLGKFVPVIGGVQIASDGYSCTLGFPVSVSNADDTNLGIVVNSHCSADRGVQDNTRLSQGGDVITPATASTFSSSGDRGRVIGELVDSQLYDAAQPTSSFAGEYDKLRCNPVCQYNDATFFVLEDDVKIEHNIARPARLNTLSLFQFANRIEFDRLGFNSEYLAIDSQMPYFTIVGVADVEIGDVVHKVGATTGWTTGEVVEVCSEQHIFNDEYGEVLVFCQNTFESLSGNILSGSGDSGSPVFKCVSPSFNGLSCNSGEVLLVGILHSGPAVGVVNGIGYGSRANFSPISSVVEDLNEDNELCWQLFYDSDCFSNNTAPPACPVEQIDIAQVVDGRWLSACGDIRDTGEYARYYAVDIPLSTEVVFDVDYERGSPRLRLINGNDVRSPSIYGTELANGRTGLEYSTSQFEGQRVILELTSFTGNGSFRFVVNDLADERVPLYPDNEPVVQPIPTLPPPPPSPPPSLPPLNPPSPPVVSSPPTVLVPEVSLETQSTVYGWLVVALAGLAVFGLPAIILGTNSLINRRRLQNKTYNNDSSQT